MIRYFIDDQKGQFDLTFIIFNKDNEKYEGVFFVDNTLGTTMIIVESKKQALDVLSNFKPFIGEKSYDFYSQEVCECEKMPTNATHKIMVIQGQTARKAKEEIFEMIKKITKEKSSKSGEN